MCLLQLQATTPLSYMQQLQQQQQESRGDISGSSRRLPQAQDAQGWMQEALKTRRDALTGTYSDFPLAPYEHIIETDCSLRGCAVITGYCSWHLAASQMRVCADYDIEQWVPSGYAMGNCILL